MINTSSQRNTTINNATPQAYLNKAKPQILNQSFIMDSQRCEKDLQALTEYTPQQKADADAKVADVVDAVVERLRQQNNITKTPNNQKTTSYEVKNESQMIANSSMNITQNTCYGIYQLIYNLNLRTFK